MPVRTRARTLRIAAGLVAAACLSGCALSDDKAASLLVAPGDYDIYSCPQLVQTYGGLKARAAELERLMGRAEADAGGRVVSAVGYRPEYLKIRGEMHEVERTGREKQCDLSAVPAAATPPPPQPPSSRAMPGLVKPR